MDSSLKLTPLIILNSMIPLNEPPGSSLVLGWFIKKAKGLIPQRTLVLGPEAVGKTTLINNLRNPGVIPISAPPPPTTSKEEYKFKFDGQTLKTISTGGGPMYIPTWAELIPKTKPHLLIFMLDVLEYRGKVQKKRLQANKFAFGEMISILNTIKFTKPKLLPKYMLVLINKKDIWETFTNAVEIRNQLFNDQFIQLNTICIYQCYETSFATNDGISLLRDYLSRI